MDCREFLLRYSEYDDSLIPPHEADRFRAHMSECPSCARYDRVLRKGRMVARQMPRPEPSPGFLPRLEVQLLASRPRPVTLSARPAMGLAAATVLMVAVTAVRVLGPAPETTAPASMAGASSPAPAAAPVRPAVRSASWLPELPRDRQPAARSWPVKEVAPEVAARYSPLETGPPVYRRAPTSPQRTSDTRRALD